MAGLPISHTALATKLVLLRQEALVGTEQRKWTAQGFTSRSNVDYGIG
jgi:hypothetical protein